MVGLVFIHVQYFVACRSSLTTQEFNLQKLRFPGKSESVNRFFPTYYDQPFLPHLFTFIIWRVKGKQLFFYVRYIIVTSNLRENKQFLRRLFTVFNIICWRWPWYYEALLYFIWFNWGYLVPYSFFFFNIGRKFETVSTGKIHFVSIRRSLIVVFSIKGDI